MASWDAAIQLAIRIFHYLEALDLYYTLGDKTTLQWIKTILLTSLNFLLGQLGASTILAYNDPKYFCRPAFFLTIPLLF